MNVVNQLSEALFVCDADSRILFLNDAGVRMESMDLRDIRGARTEDVYQMRDGSKNNVPEVIRTRKPKLNHRQYYTTWNTIPFAVFSKRPAEIFRNRRASCK